MFQIQTAHTALGDRSFKGYTASTEASLQPVLAPGSMWRHRQRLAQASGTLSMSLNRHTVPPRGMHSHPAPSPGAASSGLHEYAGKMALRGRNRDLGTVFVFFH